MQKRARDPDSAPDQRESDSKSEELFASLFHRILDGEAFKNSPVLRALLLYLWNHQGESITEYAIGVDVLGRPPDFDPKADASVRVGIARLRKKLKEVADQEMATAAFHL